MSPPAVAWDTETTLIRPGLLAPKLVCGSWADGTPADITGPRYTVQRLEAHLLNNKHVVGANVAYDMAVALAEAPELVNEVFRAYEEGRIHDVLIRQALDGIANGHLFLDPRSGGRLRDPESGNRVGRYSLAVCVDLCLGRRLAKADTYRLRYGELVNTPISEWPKEAIEYPKADAQNTLDVYNAQASFRNLHDEPAQTRAAFVLHLGAVHGMRTDPARVAALDGQIRSRRIDDRRRFQAAGIYRPDGTKDTKALAAMVSKAYDGKAPTTDKGGVKCDRDTLLDSGDETLIAFAETGENEKLFTTYLPILWQGTKTPINPRVNVLVASGRTSYGEPNLQNLPRNGGIRECFAARPGTYYCSVDYSTLELCTLAQCNLTLFGKSRMAEALNAGEDLHSLFASGLVGLDYREFLARVAAGDKAANDYRQMAKMVNFGLMGGMGAPVFAYNARKQGKSLCVMSGREIRCGHAREWFQSKGKAIRVCVPCVTLAKELRIKWLNQWPEMEDMFSYVSRIAETTGEVVQLVSERIRGGCGYSDGANTYPQGLAADGAKYAAWRVSKEAYTDRSSALFGSRPVVFVHDQIIAEVPQDQASDAAKRLTEVMIGSMRKYTPDVLIKAEATLATHWYKGAKPVYQNGKLVPWYPALPKAA